MTLNGQLEPAITDMMDTQVITLWQDGPAFVMDKQTLNKNSSHFVINRVLQCPKHTHIFFIQV